MDISYVITPFFAWLVAGCCKFAINTLHTKRLAFDLIGYGGMPSNHSSIVSSAAAIVAFKEGLQSPVLVVALALAFIVILDANSLRMKIAKHAVRLNELSDPAMPTLRERVGHSRLEILAGIATGIIAAFVVAQLPPLPL